MVTTMKINKLLILFLIILVTASIASAEDKYTAKLQYEIVQVNDGINKWSTPIQFSLNLTDSKTIGTVSIEYDDIGNSNTMIMFQLSGASSNLVSLQKNDQACILGTCSTNTTTNVPDHIGDTRLKMLDIIKIVDLTKTTTSSDNVIDLYVLCSNGDKLYLNKDSTNNYDPSLCITKTGWSSTTEKEIAIYLKRNYNVPFTLAIDTSGGYKEEAIDSNTGKYTLQSNNKYIFNIKTRRTTIWGGEIEELSAYTISVTGLSSVSGASTTPTPAPTAQQLSYSATIGSTKELTLQDGSFSASSAISINKIGTPEIGKTTWQLSFLESGTTFLTYTPLTGTPFSISFSVNERPVPTTTKKANQATGDIISDNLLIIVAVVLILIAGIYYFKGKKTKGRSVSDSDERA